MAMSVENALKLRSVFEGACSDPSYAGCDPVKAFLLFEMTDPEERNRFQNHLQECSYHRAEMEWLVEKCR